MYRHEHQRGAVAVIVAIVATLLIACMAFAIDLGYAWQVRRSMVKATDASALAAAHTQSALGTPTTGDCPTSVRNTATAYLSGNASNTTMDFCVVTSGDDDTSGGSTLGTLTVRGATQAEYSFAKLFGLNATTVHSSTTVAWSQAPLVPLMACVSTNAEPSQWFADSSSNRAPVQVAQQWSGSTSADPCSSGKSDSYALVDFSTVPTSTTDARSCTTQPATLATSLVGWLTNGYGSTISVGAYRCARVGQPYGTAVDQAICALRGRQAVVPLIDVVDKQEIPGAGKADLVRIAGFATVTVDDYTPLDGSNQCDAQFPAALGRHRSSPRVQTIAHVRSTRTRRERPTLRPAGPKDPSLTIALSPATAAPGSNITGTATIANPSAGTAWTGTLTLNFSGPQPSSISIAPSGVCGYSAGTITCPGLTVGKGGTTTVTFLTTFGSAGSGTVAGSLSGVPATGSASYTVTAPTTTTSTIPNKSVAVTIAGAGSGQVVATATGQATQTCTTGTCVWTYPQFTPVTLTQTPGGGSLFSGWSGDGSCTGSATTCSIVIPAARSLAVTATFGAAPTTTTTTIDPRTYRILTMTFQESMSSGACCSGLDHLYSYTICDVDLATRAAALNPPNCQLGAEDDDGDTDSAAALARGTTRDLTRTRLIGTHRRSTHRVRPSSSHSPTTGRNPT